MRSQRPWWLVYGACAAVVIGALLWITVTVLHLERAELRARAEAAHQEALRLALWRMDSWFAPLLAREAGRPYFDYQPFYPQTGAYSALLRPLEPGEVLAASPLLSFESEFFTIHYQINPDGTVTSPQAPSGEFRAIAEGRYLSSEQISSNAAAVESVGVLIGPEEAAQCVAAAEAEPQAPDAPPQGLARGQEPVLEQQLKSRQEAFARKGAYKQAAEPQQAARRGDGEPITVGALVPFWTDSDGAARLIFTREVRVGERPFYQGFVCDWPKLRDALLEQVRDLFEQPRLVPVRGEAAAGAAEAMMLATIPVALEVPAPRVAAVGALTPARSTLALTWLGVVAGLVAVAGTLRASVAFGAKRSRFASAVTHELRTPLTTFRMYSEMLAEGMVADPQQRQVYLETLRDESGRLSGLVENVLAYARLEEGRGPAKRRVATTVGGVLDQSLPHLRRRATAAGMTLDVEAAAPPETPLLVDPDAVEQILLNLVDNAAKYARGAAERTVHVGVAATDGTVTLTVRDHGPGVPAGSAEAIFRPFDRGSRDAGDPTPGVGLGLALARGLARDLGGELELDGSAAPGACFKLTLPRR